MIPNNNKATKKQIEYIVSLARRIGYHDKDAWHPEQLTLLQASYLIKKLRKLAGLK